MCRNRTQEEQYTGNRQEEQYTGNKQEEQYTGNKQEEYREKALLSYKHSQHYKNSINACKIILH